MATRSKPDVESAWSMQCAWMTSRHRENDRYLSVVGMQAVGINYYKLSKTCHHAQIDSFVTCWGCAQSKEAIQDHWLEDNSTVSTFGAYAIVTKMQAVQVWTMSVCQASTRPNAGVDNFVQPSSQNRAIVQTEDSYMPYQWNYWYIVSLATNPRINPYVDILIWSYP